MSSVAMLLSLSGLCAGALLLAFSIARLVRTVRAAVVARLPMLPSQALRFAGGGRYELQIEQPRRLAGLEAGLREARFSLRDAAGRALPGESIAFQNRTSGLSGSRGSVLSFRVLQAGEHRLETSGLASDLDLSRYALVFVRPHAAALVMWILSILLGAGLLIGGLVFTALLATGKLPG